MLKGELLDNWTIKKRVLIKSKHRVRKHGEVFTPQWIIDKMITIPGIKEKTEDVFATFLEPSAGEGAFLLAILGMKLRFVTDNYTKDKWRKYALWALSSIYGIEFLEDNLAIARQNMLKLFLYYYEEVYGSRLAEQSNLCKSAQTIIWANIVQGDALTHKNLLGKDITFSHWARVPQEPYKVSRTPFAYSSLFTNEQPEGKETQLNFFEATEEGNIFSAREDGSKNTAPSSQPYAVLDIELVWKEEKANVWQIQV